jgi:FeS assembly SUF system protein
MNLKDEIRIYEEAVVNVLKNIYDPEIPVNIYDLGLIYEIIVSDDFTVKIIMTLTAPNCPVAETLPVEVEEKVSSIGGITSANVEIVFEPPWDKEMMSEEAKLDLGFL